MDLPSRLDIFSIARDFLTQRSTKLDPAQVDTAGSDANIFAGTSSVLGDFIIQQLAFRTNALLLDGADNEDLDRYAFDRYQLSRKGASSAVGAVTIFRTSTLAGAGVVPLGTKLTTLTGVEYITVTSAALGAGDLTTAADVRAVQAGKCLGPDELVLRFDGTAAKAADICVGDKLMGPDSKPRRVLSLTTGTGPMFRVIPSKAEPWTCNDVHVLTLVSTETGRDGGGVVFDIPLDEFLRKPAWWKANQKLFLPAEGIEFPTREKPPIDPYFMGVWFGDGAKDLAHGPRISKPDAEIEIICRDTAKEWGLKVTTWVGESGCPTHSLASKYAGDPNPLARKMREVVGNTEGPFPETYLLGSRETRSAFLAGLLDTDGYLDKPGYYEIVQRRHPYAEGICFIARSLGMRAQMRPKIVNGQTYWRVHISGHGEVLPMRIARKVSPSRHSKKANPHRTGFRVEAIGDGAYAGFTLDGDGRFLLGDFTVTHNSTQAGAGTIVRFSSPSTLFDGTLQVNNVNPTAGGEDAEDDETFRERIRDFWRTARRGILAAIEFGARTVDGVVSAQAIEALTNGNQPARVVNLYISDSTGVASDALAQQVRVALDDFRAAGIAVIVFTSLPLIVEIELALTFRAGVDTVNLTDNVRAAVVEFVNSLPVNGTLYVSQLFSVLQRYAEDGLIPTQASIVAPVGDLVPTTGQTLRTTIANVVVD